MHRQPLITLLQQYDPAEDSDRLARDRILAFVRAHPDCFDRSLSIGHVTGSGWVLDPAGQRALLTHHRKLDLWLQLGGHCDGDPDVLAVAMREAREESGLTDIEPISPDIFDVDVHPIPPRLGVPAHDHYDVRFLLRANRPEPLIVSDESHDLAWVHVDDVPNMDIDDSVRRMHRKWMALMTAR